MREKEGLAIVVSRHHCQQLRRNFYGTVGRVELREPVTALSLFVVIEAIVIDLVGSYFKE